MKDKLIGLFFWLGVIALLVLAHYYSEYLDFIPAFIAGIIYIGFVLLICSLPIWMLYKSYNNWKENKLEEYKDLRRYLREEYELFCDYNSNLDESKALRKFFSDKTRYKIALQIKQNRKFEDENYHVFAFERLDKEEIKRRRQYSYKYESLVYEIFSPLGIRISKDKWVINHGLHASRIISDIGKKQRINLIESIKLFDEFLENGLIKKIMWSDDYYVLGDILYYWNCVSEDDLNFSKWMSLNYPYVSKNKNQYGSYIITNRDIAPLDDFINEYGSYEIIYRDYSKWYIQFGATSHYICYISIEDPRDYEHKICKLVYAYDDNPPKHVIDYYNSLDNSEETKKKILRMIKENSRYLLVVNNSVFSNPGFGLQFNDQKGR